MFLPHNKINVSAEGSSRYKTTVTKTRLIKDEPIKHSCFSHDTWRQSFGGTPTIIWSFFSLIKMWLVVKHQGGELQTPAAAVASGQQDGSCTDS